jgi:hypothetical protein
MLLCVAAWLGCLLLLALALQLRGIRKHLAALAGSRGGPKDEAPMVLETWIAEIEERGAEMLTKLQRERAAVEALVAGLEARSASFDALPPDQAKASDWARGTVTAGLQVHSWIRGGPATGLGWADTRQRVGQEWSQVQRRALDMAGRGVPPASIARSLGLAQGEVQLLLRVGGGVAGGPSTCPALHDISPEPQ